MSKLTPQIKRLARMRLTTHKGILNQLRHARLKPTNIRYVDGYFLFDMGKNAICHFNCKTTPGWQYGIWLNDEGKFALIGEHHALVDKFKPSATYISTESVEEFILTVQSIAKQPKAYFVDSMHYGNTLVPWAEIPDDNDELYCYGYQCTREYNPETELWDIFKRDTSITQEAFVNREYQEWQNEQLAKLKYSVLSRKYAFDFFENLKDRAPYITMVGVKDKNDKHWRVSPRYDISCLVDDNHVTDEVCQELYDICDEAYRNTPTNYSGYGFSFNFVTNDPADFNDYTYFYK